MPRDISLFDVQRLKKAAKQASKSSPSLSHAQALNQCAHALFGARNYHEFGAWRKTTVLKDVVNEGNGLAVCRFCGLRFATDIADDQLEHRSRHESWEEAVNALGYKPEHFAAREARKSAGYASMYDAPNPADAVDGALDVFRAWFDRSLCNAIDAGYWKQHPSFDKYVSCLLAHDRYVPPAVHGLLAARFGVSPEVIATGTTDWVP